jgi:hypothetical protein
LELKLWQMLAERDELFPAHAHSHS